MVAKKFTFEGVIAAVYTPFSEDGETPILEDIPKYSKYLTSKGIKGVLVNGTNGEGMVMSASERASVAEAWIKAGHADGLHIQVNVGGTNIKDAQYLAKHAESCGADSILTVGELYYKPLTVAELVQWIKKIADAAPSTPILYYYNPAKTGINYLNLIDILKQAGKEIPTFSGMKFGDGDLLSGAACATLDPERFKVFLGMNEILSGAYLLGFNSANCASANVFPTLNLEIRAAVKEGRLEEAKAKQDQLNASIKRICQHGNRIACFKTATEFVSGVPLGPSRFPVPPLDTQARENLRGALKELGAI